MEEVISCAKCNKMFSSRKGAAFCEVCAQDEDEIYRAIREYLFDHPGTSILELSVKFKAGINRLTHRPAGAGTGTDNAALPLQGNGGDPQRYGVFLGKRFAACRFPVFYFRCIIYGKYWKSGLGAGELFDHGGLFSESVRQKRAWQDNGNKKEHTVN